MMGWQWHQLDHMQIICTLLQTDNHASTSPLTFYRKDALPAAQPTASKQSTEGTPHTSTKLKRIPCIRKRVFIYLYFILHLHVSKVLVTDVICYNKHTTGVISQYIQLSHCQSRVTKNGSPHF